MPSTYTLIKGETLASSAASYTFTAIPSTFTDLVLRMSIRTGAATNFSAIYIEYNGDSTNTFGSNTWLEGNGASASSSRYSNITGFDPSTSVNASTTTASTFSNVELYLPSYTASQNKPFSFFNAMENNSTTGYLKTHAGLYRTNSAISQIKVQTQANTFVTGSSFYLYGIKNS